MTTYHMPAGTYYFGDPCYALRDCWDEAIEDTNFMEDFSNTKFRFRAGDTAYGDGTYLGSGMFAGKEFGVDAGLLGFVPIDEMTSTIDEVKGSGVIVEMPEPFVFEVDDGVFVVNDRVVVHTALYDDEDDDDFNY